MHLIQSQLFAFKTTQNILGFMESFTEKIYFGKDMVQKEKDIDINKSTLSLIFVSEESYKSF